MSVGNLHMLLSSPKPYPEYELLRSTTAVTEGSSFDITLNVTSRPVWANLDGETHDYVIDGSGISSSDISNASLTGTFTLQNDQAVLNIDTSVNDDTLLFVAGETSTGSQIIRKYRIDRNLNSSVLESSGGPSSSSRRWQSLFFKPDGTRMFLIDTNSESLLRVSGFTDKPVPNVDQWSILSSQVSSVDLYSQAGNVGSTRRGIWISSDGTQLMTTSQDNFNIYHRSGADLWSGSLTNTSAVGELDVFGDVTNLTGIVAKEDLSRGYALDVNGIIVEYVGDASAAGGVSNWTFNHTVDFRDLGPLPVPRDLAIDPNGQLVYIAGEFGVVWLYVMQTPWDLSTLQYVTLLDLSSDFFAIRGVYVVNPPSETLRLSVPSLDLSTTVQINDNYTAPPPL